VRFRSLLLTLVLATALLASAGASSAAAPERMFFENNGKLVSVETAHPAIETVVVEHMKSYGTAVAVSQHYVFWIDGEDGQRYGSIWRAGLRGGDPHRIVSKVYHDGALTVLGGSIYWIDPDGISRAALDGSNVRRDVVSVVPGSTGPGASGIAADRRYLYFSSCDDGTISRVSADGSDLVKRFISTGAKSCPQGLTSAGGFIYWVELNGLLARDFGRLGRARSDGSGVDDRWLNVHSKEDGPFNVAADGRGVYWTHFSTSTKRGMTSIGRARADGSHLRQAIASEPYIGALAILPQTVA
jgi:hypothetical protein